MNKVPIPKDTSSFRSMRKEHDKSITDYNQRYHEMVNEIGDCPEKDATEYFKGELTMEGTERMLGKSLAMRPLWLTSELMARIEENIKVENELKVAKVERTTLS